MDQSLMMTMQEQQAQAQHGLQLTPEELYQQECAIERAFQELTSEPSQEFLDFP